MTRQQNREKERERKRVAQIGAERESEKIARKPQFARSYQIASAHTAPTNSTLISLMYNNITTARRFTDTSFDMNRSFMFKQQRTNERKEKITAKKTRLNKSKKFQSVTKCNATKLKPKIGTYRHRLFLFQ